MVQVVALLLQCAATPGQYPTDETTSNIPFAVWFTIQVSLSHFHCILSNVLRNPLSKDRLEDTNLSKQEQKYYNCILYSRATEGMAMLIDRLSIKNKSGS